MANPLLPRFGVRVRAERERLGITQEDLADQTGLHRTYIGSVERGERNLGLINVHRIAVALGLSLSELVAGIDGGHRK